ncbi:bifunctional protein-serine/threonine kinase/phosphatase [Litoribrevibacter albus]|uniref:Protein kinase n=1 Tax=Litoribrevibacter albus TaxID=1473156 RepID=A0AA37SAW5_9GAMM|nr:bifunctional protein-serine/threonine kinase/phosphatase [Litoribrevibacter albus]GLQ31568.1 protein kinase [Litoribrevibacter albus]
MSEWHLQADAKFTVGQKSEAGVKPDNEDAIGIRIPDGSLLSNKGAVAIIADGVSAAEAGKEASETCVRNFLYDYYSTPDTWGVKKSTTKVLTALNRWLYGQGRHYIDAGKGYVSTMSCIIFKSQTATIFHVGDSRIYRLRGEEFEQLTRDHTTYISDQQSYLARAMGLDVNLDVDCRTLDIEAGDIFFLSTDGIHDFVKDRDIRNVLKNAINPDQSDLETLCQQLIELALSNNSNDNLSCQIVRVDSLPKQDVNDVTQKLTELPFPPYLDVGMTLDGYKIEKEIHASNRSQLYRVRDTETDKILTMKTPSVNYDDDPAYIERFIMESWIGSRINNPHVVKVVESSRRKSCLYYLTEFVEGITLERWINEHPKPHIEEALYIFEQIVKGVRAFHRKETLHQDLKPGNIMLDRNGEAKIIDFGSCHARGIAEIASPIEQDGILGTAGYSSPETVLEFKSNIRSEVFSLGVILYEMLTGQEPYHGKLNTCRSKSAYMKLKYTPTYEHNPLVPFWIDGAIQKALSFDPQNRHQDVSELLYEVQHPNPKYKRQNTTALVENNPVVFWQLLSLALFIAFCVALYF